MDIIGILQARGLVSTITVEPYLGQGGAVPLYGPPVDVLAYVEVKRRKIRSPNGEEVVSGSTAYCRLATVGPPKSRATVAGVVGFVINRTDHDAGTAPLPSHAELHLT